MSKEERGKLRPMMLKRNYKRHGRGVASGGVVVDTANRAFASLPGSGVCKTAVVDMAARWLPVYDPARPVLAC